MQGMIAEVLEMFFGCRHEKITRPITPVHQCGHTADETYVACLDCGKRLHYDLMTMRVGKPMTAAEEPSFNNCFLTSYR